MRVKMPCPGSASCQHRMSPRNIQESCSSSSCCELICFLPLGLSLVSHYHGSAQGLTQ